MTTQPKQHRPAPAGEDVVAKHLERELDAALEATFPASDPIAAPSLAVLKARRRQSKPQHRSR